MPAARLIVHRDFPVAPLNRNVFGAFVEHMGRCVYGGIYEPDHPTADEQGFRGDVMELTKELGPTIIRYPGGNFLSGYNWEDGVGPKSERPPRAELAWGQIESNEFGTNEFMDWCKAAGVAPMFAVNLGTRGPDAARNLLEYCNFPAGTHYSNLRIEHGYDAPHNIKFWCLGNEMDGPWQICQKTAHEYGRAAKETAKVMRMIDPDLELAACGSSFRDMPTYGAWEYEVLDECFDHVDYISLHQYFRKEDTGDSFLEFSTTIDNLDSFITEVAAIADAVAAKRRSDKRIMLSLDEWNVWYKTHHGEHLRRPGWPKAPKLIEEVYNFEDALIVGGALITMMNHADRLKAACLAQLVNVIGAIMTETGGPAWRQTIFHPFALSSRLGHGEVLKGQMACETFSACKQKAAPYVVASVVDNTETGEAVIFVLNRHDQDTDFVCELRGLEAKALGDSYELHHDDLEAVNDKDTPDRVAPTPHAAASLAGDTLTATLKPRSWNVFIVKTG